MNKDGQGRFSKTLLLTLLLGACINVQAQICEARFFHNGGVIEIGGSGMLNVSAKLTFIQIQCVRRRSTASPNMR